MGKFVEPRYFTAVREIVENNTESRKKRTLLVLGEWKGEKVVKIQKFFKKGHWMTREVLVKKYTLTLSKSICHPDDKFDMEIGIKKCMKRLKKEDIGKLTTEDYTMLTQDNCQMIVDHKADHIVSNIAKYLPKVEA